ncbi:MAG: DUF2905 domain-containing protein [Acidimicrobiia bacterium]
MKVGTLIIAIGLVVVLVGAIIRWAPWLVTWFGHLPGDIHYEGEHTTVFVPITSMIIVSVAASLILALFRRLGS